MKTLLLILSLFAPTCEKKINFQIMQGEIYIYEPAPKIYGQSIIGFVIIQDSIAKKISFKIYFSDKGIKKIDKGGYPPERIYTYKKVEKGNIRVDGVEILAYTSENFKAHKFNSEKLYKMIHPDFIIMNNRQRLEALELLVK